MRTRTKRFSVSLTEADYKKLRAVAKKHRPPLTLQYLVSWSLQRLLERAGDPQLDRDLANPIRNEDK
jgi:hypothetical protein